MMTAPNGVSPPGSKHKPPVSKRFANRQYKKAFRLVLVSDDPYSSSRVNEAEKQVRATGLAPIIEAKLNRRRDAIDSLSVLTFMVGLQLATTRPGHRATIVEVVRALNGLSPAKLRELGSPNWTVLGSYERVYRLFKRFSAALAEGWHHKRDETTPGAKIDLEYYQRQILLADIPPSVIKGAAIALDGTAVETCANFRSTGFISVDGDYSETDDEARSYVESSNKAPKKKKAAVLGVGKDGRKIYTKDSEARAGYRTSTSKRKGGPYIGREAHLGVTVAPITYTNGVDKITLNDEIPNLVATLSVVPAGSHRSQSVLPSLTAAHKAGHCVEVVADAGYTLQAKEFFLPLRNEGIAYTFRPASHQLGVKGFGDLLLVDGYPFAPYTPEDLLALTPPGFGSKGQEKEERTLEFNARASYRYSRHGRPIDGTQRLIGPIASGKIRSRAFPKSMRRSPNAPIVPLAAGTKETATVKIGVDEMLTLQQIAPFTTAHNTAYGRRQHAETANSRLKGGSSSLTNIEKGYTLLMNTAEIGVFLAHTISRLNELEYQNFVRNRKATEKDKVQYRKPRSDRLTRTSDSLDTGLPRNTSDP